MDHGLHGLWTGAQDPVEFQQNVEVLGKIELEVSDLKYNQLLRELFN